MVKKLSQTGLYYIDSNTENQDVVRHARNKQFCVISLADGVSGCKEAKSGAEIASGAITNLLLKKGDYFLEFEQEQVAQLVLSHILFELKKCAENTAENIEEYSSTVASVLIDKKRNRMLCFNLGDGMIMASGRGKCRILSMPAESKNGYVTTTINAYKMVSVRMFDIEFVDSVVICSNGAWKQMFNKSRMKPEIFNLLVNNEYDRLKTFFTGKKCSDDCSFISLNIRQIERRKRIS